MGGVYKTEDTKLDRSVALKLLAAPLQGNEDVRKRLEREAKLAAALDHPNVCHVHEIGEAEGQTMSGRWGVFCTRMVTRRLFVPRPVRQGSGLEIERS